MRVFIKSIINQTIEKREEVKEGGLPEDEYSLQIRTLTAIIKKLHEAERLYNKQSLKLLKERIK